MQRSGVRRGRARRTRATRVVVALVLAAVAVAGAAATTPAAAQRAPALDAETLTARSLLATVPHGYRATCTVGDAADASLFSGYGPSATSVAATLNCSPDDLVVLYDQFTDATAMQAAFDYHFEAIDGPTGFGECPSRTSYQIDGTSTGTVACRVEGDDTDLDDGIDPGTTLIAFTYAPTATLVWIITDDPDLGWSFFEDDAGPLSEADDAGIAPIATRGRLLAAARRMAQHLPTRARRTCLPVEEITPATLQSLYPERLFVVADVEECTFPGGIEAEYVQFASRGSMNARFDRFTYDGPRIARYRTFTCPGQGRYQGGRWGCYVTATDADGQASTEDHATVMWTHDRLRIHAYGTAPATDAERLLEWFVHDAGPDP